MKRRLLSVILASAMTVSLLAGCGAGAEDAGSGNDTGDQTEATGTAALADTSKVDSAIENATEVEDSSGFVYTGEGPITEEGGTIKILARTSNYSNVDITKAPIVQKVFEEAGVEPDWQLIDYNSYEDSATPLISSGETDADIILIPDADPNQVYIKSGLFVPLDEYFDYMPNYTKWLSEHTIEKVNVTTN